MNNPTTDNPIRHYFGDFAPVQKTRADGDSDGDEKRRTYKASISSTTPQTFRGYDYMRRRDVVISETLLHGEDNVDLRRLNNGANVLFNHDRNDYIGSVKSAYTDGKRAWAEFQFGDNDSARENKPM